MKILVIKNKDKFIDELYNHLPIVGDPFPAERERLKAFFKDYEQDVIGFEAEVGIAKELQVRCLLFEAMNLHNKLVNGNCKINDKLQVFVVKPKKPEGKDEIQHKRKG